MHRYLQGVIMTDPGGEGTFGRAPDDPDQTFGRAPETDPPARPPAARRPGVIIGVGIGVLVVLAAIVGFLIK
jgi:hypothetical protein